MPNRREVRDAGVKYVISMLASKGWKCEIEKKGRAEMHKVERGDKKFRIKIRILSKETPVPFSQGLDVLKHIDYLVICNNLQEQPRITVLDPETVRKIIHKDTLNDDAYWLQNRHYDTHGLTFEQVFG